MPNYSLILDTKFKPFSYDELIKPALMQTQAHQAIEEEYGNLATKASVWERMANEQTDPYAYKMYKTYSEDLENMADQLARSGLDLTSRRSMLNMKSRYSSEILPIETAYKRREELATEQRKAMASNPTLRYQRMAGQMSLDDFIRNPSLDYGESYSGALLTQQVSQAVANYAKVLTEEGGLERLGLPYQYKSKIRYGASPEEILAVINEAALEGHQGAVDFLRSARDQVIRSSGIRDWADPNTLKDLIGFANQGLFSSLGQTSIKNYTDEYNIQNALRNPTPTGVTGRQDGLKMYNINPTSLYGTSDVSSMNKSTLEELNKWRNKGYINGQGKLTKRGWRAMSQQLLYDATGAANSKSPYVRGASYPGKDKEFLNWATQHGVNYTVPQRVENWDNQGRSFYTYIEPVLRGFDKMTNYYNSTRSKIDSGELVTGTPNIDVYRIGIKDKDSREYIKEKITAALAGGDIFKVGSLHENANGAIAMEKGDKVSAKDFEAITKNTPILYVVNSPVTNNQFVELTDGTRYILPNGVLDNVNWANLNTIGDPNNPNSVMGSNQRLGYAASLEEAASILNESNSYLGTLLDYNTGAKVVPSDGTIMVR